MPEINMEITNYKKARFMAKPIGWIFYDNFTKYPPMLYHYESLDLTKLFSGN
jgi:hypothetical protein